MSDAKLQQGYMIEGNFFATKAEANDFIRIPKIKAALMKATSQNEELSEWFIENQELVEQAFDIGTIRRVTKAERKKLAKALETVEEAVESFPNLKFLAEISSDLQETFRWPTVKRMNDEEKREASLNALAEVGAEVAEWIVDNKDVVLESFEAGKIKREVSPKATEGLAAYRAKLAAEKEAKEAAAK
jgi:ribosomal protein S6